MRKKDAEAAALARVFGADRMPARPVVEPAPVERRRRKIARAVPLRVACDEEDE